MDSPQYDLIADIGGTNARFALTDPRAPRPALLQQQSLRCAEFGSLQHAAEHYLAAVGARPTRAAIAVACPVTGDAIPITGVGKAQGIAGDFRVPYGEMAMAAVLYAVARGDERRVQDFYSGVLPTCAFVPQIL